ncbi:MAG: hypothetical protein H0X40_16555 [Chthoniobacterales bacterium]|nr:hypothetical protein [Chthoniobacterales bacterium]
MTTFSQADQDFGKKRKALKDAYDSFTPAATTLLDWLNAARPISVSHFGYRWSADWAAVGFVNNSTALPDQIGDRIGLAASIVVYLTENPSFEVAATGVTEATGMGCWPPRA